VAYSQAREAALTALELEPGLADAHAILGTIHMYYDWDWEAAEREFRRAVEIGSCDPFLEAQYAVYLSLMGRRAEAETAFRRTMQRAPNSLALRLQWALMFIHLRDLDRAQQEADALVRDYPDNDVALSTAIVILEGLRLWDEAARLKVRRSRLRGYPEEVVADFEATYREGGQAAVYRWRLRRIEAGGPGVTTARIPIARVYAFIGEFDKAFEYLDLAIEEREPFVLPWLRAPFFPREFEQHPRFQAHIERLGLPPLPDAG
jgi:tetratricopeptide (TPR) repeat protein